MVVKNNTDDKQQFMADIERLSAAGLSNAEIGRSLNIHRNAIRYWRLYKGQRGPSRLTVEALREKLNILLAENDLTPSR